MANENTKTPASPAETSKRAEELTDKDLDTVAGGTTVAAPTSIKPKFKKSSFVDGGVESVDNWMSNA